MWHYWQSIEFGRVAASQDMALDWLAREMQQVCAHVNHASSVLTSLSHYGNHFYHIHDMFYSVSDLTRSLKVCFDLLL